MNMTDFVNSNYIKAEDLAESVCIEAIIVSVQRREFEESGETKPVVHLEDGRGVVLNQTRLKAMIRAFGPNSDNWIGKPIMINRGLTVYAGKDVPAVVIEPVVSPRIAVEPRQGRVTMESGKSASSEPSPVYDERNPPPIDDDIPL